MSAGRKVERESEGFLLSLFIIITMCAQKNQCSYQSESMEQTIFFKTKDRQRKS